jgi:integrase
LSIQKRNWRSGPTWQVRWRDTDKGERQWRTFDNEAEAVAFNALRQEELMQRRAEHTAALDAAAREGGRRARAGWDPLFDGDERILLDPSVLLVADLLESYYRDFQLRECASVRSVRCDLRRLHEHFGAMPASEVRVRVVRDYQALLKTQGYAAATVNRRVKLLHAAFNLAADDELIEHAPKFPKSLRPATPRQGFFTQDDYHAVLRELPTWARPVLTFGFYSGWRRSEVLGLTRDEVDLDGGFVRLDARRSKNREARKIPLRGFGHSALKEALEHDHFDDSVFARWGTQIKRTTFYATWRRATAAAGRPKLLYHDLRRSVVRRLELARVPRKVAMAWVGHKTEAMYQRYSIMVDDDLLTAADTMLRFEALRGAPPS